MFEAQEQKYEEDNSFDIPTQESASSRTLSTYGLDEPALLVECNPNIRAISIDNVSDLWTSRQIQDSWSSFDH